MTTIEVCNGNSCRAKGSEKILEELRRLVTENGFSEKTVIREHFCHGLCNKIGVTVTLDGIEYACITVATLPIFWERTVLPKIQKDMEADG